MQVNDCFPAAKRNVMEWKGSLGFSIQSWDSMRQTLARGSFFGFCLINSEIYNCMQLPSGSIELKEGGNCFARWTKESPLLWNARPTPVNCG